MRLVVLSDTHMLHPLLDIPNGDVVIHCGDWTSEETLVEYDDFFLWFSQLPHRHKILISGNHEEAMEQMGKYLRKKIPSNITYLEDTHTIINGLKFWGSPRTPLKYKMAFTYTPTTNAAYIWDKIPLDTDILITHGPPFGILDKSFAGQNIGDLTLLERVKLVKPKYHLFGHTHGRNGQVIEDETCFINAAIGDDDQIENLSELIHVIDI